MLDLRVIADGRVYLCQPASDPNELAWGFPVGEGDYPPEAWYCATWHDPTGVRNGGYQHTGIDLNLDCAERGDVERRLGLSIYSLAAGVVDYITSDWSGVPMLVIRHEYEGAPLWVRYAHLVPVVTLGEAVLPRTKLGGFANWRTGDHLHLDAALDRFTREWLTPGIRWVDPVPVLKTRLDAGRVDAMLRRGG